MKRTIVVAVDGPAGAGKSSVSKEVALKTGLKYIDSGALYRSITWYMLNRYGAVGTTKNYGDTIKNLDLRQDFKEDGTILSYVNNKDVSDEIRTETIAKNIGVISDNIDIRNFVNTTLRDWAHKDSILMDGRDIGTVVFPTADIKIYLDASVEERAKRRYYEYQEKGKNVDVNDIKHQIILRDEQDKNRKFGALKKADDALYLDTSDMNKEQVIDKFVSVISEKLK
jgi:cytidylate kinase